MSKKWRLTERTKTLLTLELSIVLPAAALMGFSIWNLKHIQRDKSIEAAIQRDSSPEGYSPPASTQSFATDVKHLNHPLRHIDGSRSVAQDARVSEHGLRNHMPTALDLVKGNDRRRSARPQESIR